MALGSLCSVVIAMLMMYVAALRVALGSLCSVVIAMLMMYVAALCVALGSLCSVVIAMLMMYGVLQPFAWPGCGPGFTL